MVAYRDCKGHLVCMADAQTGIVEIQHKDRAVRMTVPVGDSFTVTLRDTENEIVTGRLFLLTNTTLTILSRTAFKEVTANGRQFRTEDRS